MALGTHRRSDQVSVFDTVGGHAALTFQTFETYESWFKWKWSAHASGLFLGIVNYFQFKESAWVKEVLDASAHVVYASNLTISQYRLRMWGAPMMRYAVENAGNPALDPHGAYAAQANLPFYQAQKNLPPNATGAANKAAYGAFVARFGTHYMASAIMGGYAEVYVCVDSKYVVKANAEETFKFVEITFAITFFGLGFKGGYSHEGFHAKAELSEEFQAATTILVVSTGGSYLPIVAAGVLAEATFGMWGMTVQFLPAPIFPQPVEIFAEHFFQIERAGIAQLRPGSSFPRECSAVL